MKRIAILTILALLALPAGAADTTPPKKGNKLPSNIEQIRALDLAKARFMAAIGACPRPENCDPASPARSPELVALLEQASQDFMVACVQCATDQACEKESERIRSGRGRSGYNICAPPKPSTPAPADKKPPPTSPSTK